MGKINMRVFILTGTLLLVQLSHQAAVLEAAEDVSELAFPDGEVEEAVPREDDGETTGINDGVCVPMTWAGAEGVLCTDDEYAAWNADSGEHAWCPCFDYDNYYYAYEMDLPSQEAARSLDRKKTKHHAGRSLDRKKKKSKKHHSG